MRKLVAHVGMVMTFVAALSCSEKDGANGEHSLFPMGDHVPEANFTGNAWNKVFVAPDTVYDAAIGNVYFEAGARSNWHIHPAGQILIVIEGEGYHQMEGMPKQIMRGRCR